MLTGWLQRGPKILWTSNGHIPASSATALPNFLTETPPTLTLLSLNISRGSYESSQVARVPCNLDDALLRSV